MTAYVRAALRVDRGRGRRHTVISGYRSTELERGHNRYLPAVAADRLARGMRRSIMTDAADIGP